MQAVILALLDISRSQRLAHFMGVGVFAVTLVVVEKHIVGGDCFHYIVHVIDVVTSVAVH